MIHIRRRYPRGRQIIISYHLFACELLSLPAYYLNIVSAPQCKIYFADIGPIYSLFSGWRKTPPCFQCSGPKYGRGFKTCFSLRRENICNSKEQITTVREAPAQEKHGSNGFCPNSVSTPPPSSKRTLCGSYFCRKSVNFLKQRFSLAGASLPDSYPSMQSYKHIVLHTNSMTI